MIDINLLPWRKKAELMIKQSRQRQMVCALFLAALILFGATQLLQQGLEQVKQRRPVLEAQLQQLTQGIEQMKELYPTLRYSAVPGQDFGVQQQQQQGLLSCLSQIANLLPTALVLKEIRYEKKAWLLQGMATELASILAYVEDLKSLSPGSGLRHPVLDIKTKEGLYFFQLQLEQNACQPV